MKHALPLVAVALLSVACASAPKPAPDPGVGPARMEHVADAAADSVRRIGYTAADVRFLQGMMGHHGQALVMTALVPSRTSRADVRMLAQRIEQSQQAEIAQMRHWLESRGETVPAAGQQPHAMAHMDSTHPSTGSEMHGMAGMDMAPMPGMLTEAELAALAATTGPAFDRLFLQDMIRHHEGALTMVAGLLGTQGSGQEPELDRLVSDVDADQRAEIARMRTMLRVPDESRK